MVLPRLSIVLGLAAPSTALPLQQRASSFVPTRRQCRRGSSSTLLDRGGGSVWCGCTDASVTQLSAWNPWGGDDDGGGGWGNRDHPNEVRGRDAPGEGGEAARSRKLLPPRSEIRRIEQEVEAEAMARLDRKRVAAALYERDEDNALPDEATASPVRNVALAAGFAAATLTFVTLHSWITSTIAYAVVTYLANRDPNEEQGVAGALARILGRWTLTSVDTATPKVKAAIRAAATGEEEVATLRNRVRELEDENESLRVWVERRRAVDDAASRFTLDELKDRARECGVSYSGRTKAQIMMALLENGGMALVGNGRGATAIGVFLQDVTIHRGGYSSFGISLKLNEDAFCVVNGLSDNGAAAAEGTLRPGDIILSVNGRDARGWSFDQTRNAILSISPTSPLVLDIFRSPAT